MRVLVVEDQAELADDIADGLRDRGIGADVAYDGPAGIVAAPRDHSVVGDLLVAAGGMARTGPPRDGGWDENADPSTRRGAGRIGRLRHKLGEPDPTDPVVGSGYRLP